MEVTFGGMHADLISWRSLRVDAEEPGRATAHEEIHFSRTEIRKS
ncbi:MAG: hypothetical protein V1792_28575 [Pseudomonadota bacterium]